MLAGLEVPQTVSFTRIDLLEGKKKGHSVVHLFVCYFIRNYDSAIMANGTHLKLVRFSMLYELGDEFTGVMVEVDVLVHEPVDDQQPVGPGRRWDGFTH